MAHKLVQHLWFSREKWLTGYDGLSAADAVKKIGPLIVQDRASCIALTRDHKTIPFVRV